MRTTTPFPMPSILDRFNAADFERVLAKYANECEDRIDLDCTKLHHLSLPGIEAILEVAQGTGKIGRASCRERVYVLV